MSTAFQNSNFHLKVWILLDLGNKCCQLFSSEWQAHLAHLCWIPKSEELCHYFKEKMAFQEESGQCNSQLSYPTGFLQDKHHVSACGIPALCTLPNLPPRVLKTFYWKDLIKFITFTASLRPFLSETDSSLELRACGNAKCGDCCRLAPLPEFMLRHQHLSRHRFHSATLNAGTVKRQIASYHYYEKWLWPWGLPERISGPPSQESSHHIFENHRIQ